MSLDDIINVQISRETQAVTKAGFGTLLFLDNHTVFPERVREYTSVTDMISDGFLAADPAVIAATAYFGQSPSPVKIKIGRTDGVESLATAMTAIVEADNDWYGFASYLHTQAGVLALAGIIETMAKIYGTSESAADVKNGVVGNILKQLEALNYDRTFLLFDEEADTVFPEAAWFGKMLTTGPGEATWKFKTLAGVDADPLSATQNNNILNDNGNTYQEIGGVSITCNGTMVSGEFIDVMRGVDWLDSRMTERIFSVLVNSPKIPYTDAGVAVIETEIRAQLDEAVDEGVINGEIPYTVTVPKVADVSQNDKALRTLPPIKFRAVLAGAIHKVEIRGVVTV